MGERTSRRSIEDIYGTLPDWVLKEYIRNGTIKIKPLVTDWEEKLGPLTIDFHLGRIIYVPEEGPHSYVDIKKGVRDKDYKQIILDDGGLHILMPEQFIIAETVEELDIPDDIVGRLEGKSSLARLGIVVHLTAGRFDPGWSNYPVLELKNNTRVPVVIYQGWPVCAFSFERLMAPVERPLSKDDRYSGPGALSRIHTDHR